MIRRRALTLPEVLAVTLLLGLIAAIAFPRLTVGADDARCRAAVAEFIELDAHARRCAERDGPVILSVLDGDDVALRRGDELIVHRSFIPPLRLALVVNGVACESIDIDALGRSPDYTVIATLGDIERTVMISGLTGWTERIAP